MEHLRSKDSHLAELHAKNRMSEKQNRGSEASNDARIRSALKEEISLLQRSNGLSEAELAAKSLDGTLTNSEIKVREYKAHADKLGARVKKADEEIARLKADALLKEVQLNDMSHSLQATESVLQELKSREAAIKKAKVESQSSVGVQTELSGNVKTCEREEFEECESGVSEEEIRRQKNWSWVTQTYQDMISSNTGARTEDICPETEVNDPVDCRERSRCQAVVPEKALTV